MVTLKNNKNITTRNILTGKELGLSLNIDKINAEAKEKELLKNMQINSLLLLDKCNPINEKTIRILKEVDEMLIFNENLDNFQHDTFPKVIVTEKDRINNREILKNKQREFIETFDELSPTEENNDNISLNENKD